MKHILGNIRKADNDYNLIQDDDIIAVGVSGGKDSIVLLDALNTYSKFKLHSFKIMAIHIAIGFENMNMESIKNYCKEQEIEYHEFPTDIYEILKLHEKDNNISCSLCAKLRRAALINNAKELGCNTIALGHTADDAIETIFLNAIYGGRLATFEPIVIFDNSIKQIRPLLYTFESEIKRAVRIYNLPVIQSTCPNNGSTEREKMKRMFHQLCQEYPQSKENLLKMLYNDDKIMLWHPKKEGNDNGN